MMRIQRGTIAASAMQSPTAADPATLAVARRRARSRRALRQFGVLVGIVVAALLVRTWRADVAEARAAHIQGRVDLLLREVREIEARPGTDAAWSHARRRALYGQVARIYYRAGEERRGDHYTARARDHETMERMARAHRR